MILRPSCEGHAFRSINEEIMNQEEDGQHNLYAGVLHPIGTDCFVETHTLNFSHKH